MRLVLATALATSLFATACTGAINDSGDGDGDMGGGDPVEVDIIGPSVLPHVQRFANAVCGATGACTIGTREGHSPTADRAIDILASDAFGKAATDGNELGDTVAQYALDRMADYGVMYVIWLQRYNDGSGWDPMEDRGGITANHYDHVHISFEATAP